MRPRIAKLGHVAVVTPDIEKSLWFFRDIVGLEEVDNDGSTVFLRAWGEFEHHSLSLTEGPAAGIDHIGFRAATPEDIEELAERFQKDGLEFERVDGGVELGQGEAIRFALPGGGHAFEIYYDVEKPAAPEGMRSRLINQTGVAWKRGISPRRIDHVNLWMANPESAEGWLQEVLGFKVRERLRVPGGPLVGSWIAVTSLVHDIALMASPTGQDARLNHFAYYLENFQDVLRAADILADANIPIDLGPGRHRIGQAVFCYVRDPGSGHRFEVYAGGYQIFDPDWEPVEWSTADLGERGETWWGEKLIPGATPTMEASTPCVPVPEPVPAE